MTHSELAASFHGLTTALVADACLRTRTEIRCAPPEIRPLMPTPGLIAGRARPAQHYGSVDVFLEALEQSAPGDVLVVDNGGRRDEACIGDLIALEAKQSGLAAIVVWGLHRDTADLLDIGLPIFSTGATPTGPLQLQPREPEALVWAQIGPSLVDTNDLVLADADGVLFIPAAKAEELANVARRIHDTERAQAAHARSGVSLRSQFHFSDYLARRAATPSLTFRQHLRRIGGAVEE